MATIGKFVLHYVLHNLENATWIQGYPYFMKVKTPKFLVNTRTSGAFLSYVKVRVTGLEPARSPTRT